MAQSVQSSVPKTQTNPRSITPAKRNVIPVNTSLVVREKSKSSAALQARGVELEPIRCDELTEKRFVFFREPDGLPLEL
jgi:hypothetical protein